MKFICTIVLLAAFILAGCVSIPDPSDASKWTVELASTDNSPSGLCRIYDARQNLMLEGTLVDGKMDGVWVTYNSTGGRTAVVSYKEGVRSGPIEMWYGAFAVPEAKGHLKLTGTFVDGHYDGTVARFYPSGAKESVREYRNNLLVKTQYWSPDGIEQPASSAQAHAAAELNLDLEWISRTEGMIPMSLAHAIRKSRAQ